MSSCACKHLGPWLQEPAHQLHEAAGLRMKEIADAVPRYIAMLRRRTVSDPLTEALIARASVRLKAIHRAAEPYLPPGRPISPVAPSRKTLPSGRANNTKQGDAA